MDVSGVGVRLVYLWRIKASRGKGGVMRAHWDVMTSPGVCSALLTVTLPGTIMNTLTYLPPPPAPEE